MDKKLISKEQFGELEFECKTAENKIGAFMFYLRKSDLKGLKYKKPE